MAPGNDRIRIFEDLYFDGKCQNGVKRYFGICDFQQRACAGLIDLTAEKFSKKNILFPITGSRRCMAVIGCVGVREGP